MTYELEVKGKTAEEELALLEEEVADFWVETDFSYFQDIDSFVQGDIRKAREWVFLVGARISEYRSRTKGEGKDG